MEPPFSASAFLRKALSTKVRVQMLIFRNNSDI